MSEWESFVDRVLKENPDVKAEYDRFGLQYRLIADVIRLRLRLGLTQEQLAQRMGKQQPAIARLEAGRGQPSIAFLNEVAEALDAKLVVRLEEKDGATERAS